MVELDADVCNEYLLNHHEVSPNPYDCCISVETLTMRCMKAGRFDAYESSFWPYYNMVSLLCTSGKGALELCSA